MVLVPELVPGPFGAGRIADLDRAVREFTAADRRTIQTFVAGGGALVCMIGAEQARPSAALLADFQFRIPPSPVPPGEEAVEPEPLSYKQGRIAQSDRVYQFHAAWPIECKAAGATSWSVWNDGPHVRPIVISHADQGGPVVVIGDTHFAANENLEFAAPTIPDNSHFWRWLLNRVIARRESQPPPAATGSGENGPAETAPVGSGAADTVPNEEETPKQWD